MSTSRQADRFSRLKLGLWSSAASAVRTTECSELCCQMEAMHKVCSTTGLFYCACAFPGLSAGRGEKGYYTNIYIQIIYSFGFCLFASIPYDLTKIKTSVEKEGFHVQFMQIHVVVIFIWRCKILAPVSTDMKSQADIFLLKPQRNSSDSRWAGNINTCYLSQFLTQFNTASRLTGTLICSNKKLNVKIFVISIVRVAI